MTGRSLHPRDEAANEAKCLHSHSSGSVHSTDYHPKMTIASVQIMFNVLGGKKAKNDVLTESQAGRML